MSTPTLPDLGQNGLVNSVRKISGTTNPGYRKVDSTCSFVAGNVAVLKANATTGVPEVTTAIGSETTVIGLFFCHKQTSFYRPVICEKVTFGTSPNSATVGYLSHANLKGAAGTYVIVSSTGTSVVADYTYGASTNDFTLSYTNGTITRRAAGAIGATTTVYVTYFYQDPNLVGIDQTLGSGMAATLEDRGEVATLAYCTTYPFTLNAALYSNADGYLVPVAGRVASGASVGYVTKVPTSDDPELHFKLQL